jgi:hypothetical protein
MARRNSVAFRLSLVAVFFGLYALCPTGGMRTSAVAQSVAVGHVDPAAFDTNSWTAGYLQRVSHLHMMRAVPRASTSSSLFQAVSVITPDVVETALARENILALGGTRRATGPSRAPPTA